jgi:flagellar motor switch protein FliM
MTALAEPSPPPVKLLRFALEGERVRRAAQVLERESPRLASALRRAIPFLARRNVPITLSYSRAVPVAELLESLARPIHATHLVITPGGGGGALLFDAGAIGMFLDGVLGGDGGKLPELLPSGLTSPQTALIAGLATGIVRALSDALASSLGMTLACRSAELHDATVDSAPIACLLELGEPEGAVVGRVAILLAKEPLLAACPEAEPPSAATDPRVASVLEGVELDLVAELGSLRLSLREVARLGVGDTLRLDAAVGATVSVRAEGCELFRGRPTTSGGRIALKIAGGHEG